jgi:hypothetical protein
MKLWLTRIAFTFLGILCLGSVVYLFAIASFSGEPSGKFSSWKFFPHDANDVLRFEAGVVTLETCCGIQDQGLYSKNPDGSWNWVLQRSVKRTPESPVVLSPITKFRIERRLFHLRIQSLEDSKIELDMRRRIFNNFPL